MYRNEIYILHTLPQWVEHVKSIFKTIFKKFFFHLMSKNRGFVDLFFIKTFYPFHLMSKKQGFVAPFSQKNTASQLKTCDTNYFKFKFLSAVVFFTH